MKVYRVAGYVKLAKLWERSREQAIKYHNEYYRNKFLDVPEMDLVDVFIDITGSKHMRNRPQMIRLIAECMAGRVDCIATQTVAYLAANNEDLFHLLHFLFLLDPPVHIVTEDENYHIDTIRNADNQMDALMKMTSDFVKLNPAGYEKWKKDILQAVKKR